MPMIARWPGKVAGGATDDFVWAFWDMLPTLAELGGAEAPDAIDGISVAPRLLGEPQAEPDRILYWETPIKDRSDLPPWSMAVRWGKWKAIRLKSRTPVELYDLETDVGEQENVVDEHPDVIGEIAKRLKGMRTVPRTLPPQEPSWGYDRLKTGYVK